MRYPNFLVLSSDTYELYWKYTAGTSRLDIAVRARTTGWVGFGVSERGNMVNADIAVGWVTDQGEVRLKVRAPFAASTYTMQSSSIRSAVIVAGVILYLMGVM